MANQSWHRAPAHHRCCLSLVREVGAHALPQKVPPCILGAQTHLWSSLRDLPSRHNSTAQCSTSV